MVGLFKQKNPANILLLLVFGLLIKLPLFINPHVPIISNTESILYKGILNFLEPTGKDNPVLYSFLSFGLLFLQAVMLTRFINNQRMMSRLNYYPGMAYLLITCLFPGWNYFSAPLIVNSILLYILSALFRIYNHENAKATIFNIGLALGISGFIFFPSLTFIIWILLALIIMRPFRLNEWVLCILGLTTPFYFYAIYLVIINQWSWNDLLPHFTMSLPQLKQSAWIAGSAFLLTVPFLSGSYYVQESLRRMLIHVRKGWSLILLYLLGAIFVPFFTNSESFENWVIVAIPLAAFHACTYLYANFRVLPNLAFWLSVAFILAYQYYGPGW
ncbi:MAG TPA: hypothetical protein PKC72_11735 [Chitinophagaceae bacterium]|nr:hypothetical protein [Chitinophagaceae bacterium]